MHISNVESKMVKKKILLSAVFLVMSGSALAAADGVLGTTSTGTVAVSLTTEAAPPESMVQITGLQDVNFGIAELGVDPGSNMSTGICVYLNFAETYAIEVTTQSGIDTPSLLGGGVGGALLKPDGDTTIGQFIAYTVNFNDGSGGGAQAGVAGGIATGLAGNASPDCGGTGPASLLVDIPFPLNNALPFDTTLTDTIFLTVSPE
jgi:hypothetical protein